MTPHRGDPGRREWLGRADKDEVEGSSPSTPTSTMAAPRPGDQPPSLGTKAPRIRDQSTCRDRFALTDPRKVKFVRGSGGWRINRG